jgi:predicted AlkP superfamily phosphohydrolase/phosphomutase
MSRVLAFAMDAADGALVRRWVAEGRLPTLGRLAERGFSIPLRSVAERFPDGVWPALMTGCMPGTTGYYNWRCVRPGTTAMVFSPNRVRRRQFWELIHDEGNRVVIVDVPKSSPKEGATVLVGWGQRAATRRESSPPELYDDVVRRYGRYPRWLDDDFNRTNRGHRRYFSVTERMLRDRTALLRELLEGNEWDFALGSFPESHNAGHVFHRYLDRSGWAYDERKARRFGDHLLRVYQAIDRSIGELIELAPDADVIVFSGHGMTPNPSGNRLLPRLLERLGYTVPAAAPPALPRALGMARSAIPWHVRRYVNGRLSLEKRNELQARMWSSSHDWDRTRAVAEAEFGNAWVRVNLRGREPHGIVEPGDEYERLRDELILDLSALVDVDTGEPAACEVLRREELIEGPNADALPDVFVRWAPGRFLGAARHPRVGVVREAKRDVARSEHDDHAFMIGAGPRLRNDVNGLDPHICSVAPTMLALMGAPVPDDMEGEPLGELLGPDVPAPRRAAVDWAQDPWAAEPSPI